MVILALSLCVVGGWREKKKVRGGQWEGEREVFFPIVHHSFALDKFIVLILRFGIEDFADPGLLRSG